mmetsp:Transcript_5938/g.13062  ORF Transcript_5938/g.13062 Transcript_5938/m.13062 type:complete len:186 (-) Transcript_5938:328-885(-)
MTDATSVEDLPSTVLPPSRTKKEIVAKRYVDHLLGILGEEQVDILVRQCHSTGVLQEDEIEEEPSSGPTLSSAGDTVMINEAESEKVAAEKLEGTFDRAGNMEADSALTSFASDTSRVALHRALPPQQPLPATVAEDGSTSSCGEVGQWDLEPLASFTSRHEQTSRPAASGKQLTMLHKHVITAL